MSETESKTSPSVQLEKSWLLQLESEFEKDYMKNLKGFLLEQRQKRKIIFPKGSEFFNAFNLTPYDQVKVVILGQDPYHGPGQAHGLCFSVLPGVRLPPSLQNIFKEIKEDLGIDLSAKPGFLEAWAKQGVLLLNSVLSVERGRAGSHAGKGWENFTDRAIQVLNEREEPMVFILWGSYAQKKAAFVDTKKHMVLKSPHPSPLSAHRGFFGCKHFSQANQFLESKGLAPINWNLD